MAQLFAADDKFPDVVAALQARGWRRLPFVGCPKFDLKWTNYAKIAWRRVTPAQIVNHLQHAILFSQKDHFADLLYARAAAQRDGGQFLVDSCFPRTFDCSKPRDRILLQHWFVYSQAVAVLKQSLVGGSTVVGDAELKAAMRLTRDVLSGNNFLEKWREEEAKTECTGWVSLRNEEVEEMELDCSRQEIEQILRQLERRDPQFHALGSGGSNVWICKPSNLSQGRGIVLCSSLEELAEITSGGKQVGREHLEGGVDDKVAAKWIVQKYIERPLLLQSGRKFDIRQWVLITELEPKPVAFWFHRSYLRFCARKFELTRLQDQFTHLSNYSIQQHYVPVEPSCMSETIEDTADCSKQREKLGTFEPMWPSEQFRDILR
ncbi:unnamed protein product [Phytophthora fragariaefolia]|uniref:Unnamed protein product n=1 Tax=Phytophthora fragariaefolia TaxID=1490495 RepID=A0A9W6XGL2_9STRA|nr:unnamed protein product [Phytophthora fragariaefolia]